MKKLTLFIEEDVLLHWKKLLHFQKLYEENLEAPELFGEYGLNLMEEIIDYVERDEKILHIVKEVN